MKPHVTSAFLISYELRRVEYKIPFRYGAENFEISSHDRPLFILNTYSQVIEFLCRYTDFAQYNNGDKLAMKWELKNAHFSVEIIHRKELQDAIMTDYYKHSEREFSWENSYYPEHYIHIIRLPLGVQGHRSKMELI